MKRLVGLALCTVMMIAAAGGVLVFGDEMCIRDRPIIAMTANAFTDDREASAEAGMNEHLAKPLNADELMDTVRKYYNKEEY